MLTKLSRIGAEVSSSLVAGFDRVSISSGLVCPFCGKAFGPHDLRHDGSGGTQLCCAACSRDAITAQLAPIDEEDE
jgi:hypothetical protein